MRPVFRFGALLFSGLLLTAAACPSGSRSATATAVRDTLPTGAAQAVYGFQTEVTVNGATQGRLRARVAYIADEASRISLVGLTMAWRDSLGRELARLTADSGEYAPMRSELIAQHQVRLRGSNAQVLATEAATAHFDERKVRGTLAWTLGDSAQRNISRRGTGFVTDPLLQRLNLKDEPVKPAPAKPAAAKAAPAKKAPTKPTTHKPTTQ